MRRFRKIVVDTAEYQWLFRYDDDEYIADPYLLIVNTAFPKTTWRIKFRIREHFLFNSGLPAVFQGEKAAINLNRPVYIAQIIRKCREEIKEIAQYGYIDIDGIEILQKIGYEILPASWEKAELKSEYGKIDH